MDGRIILCHIIDRRRYDYVSHGSGKGVSEHSGHLGALFNRFVPKCEIGQGESSVLLDVKVKRQCSLVGDIDDAGRERKGRSVEDIVVEPAVSDIVHVEIEALDHLGHEGLGAEGLDLVVNVGIGVEQAELRDLGIGGYGLPAGIGLYLYLGGTGIHRRGLQHIEHCKGKAQGSRNGEPVPFGQALVQEVHQLYGLLLLVLGVVGIIIHFLTLSILLKTHGEGKCRRWRQAKRQRSRMRCCVRCCR